jgi:mannose-6-phosphate isomerase-like protein (cupin superfamily)
MKFRHSARQGRFAESVVRREATEERSPGGAHEALDADQRHRRAFVPYEVQAGLQVSGGAGATAKEE